MFDGVAVRGEGVETGVTAYRVFRARDVVAYGGGQQHHRYTESRVILSRFSELAQGGESFEAADDEECIDFVDVEAVCRLAHANLRRKISVGANLGSTFADPTFNI